MLVWGYTASEAGCGSVGGAARAEAGFSTGGPAFRVFGHENGLYQSSRER